MLGGSKPVTPHRNAAGAGNFAEVVRREHGDESVALGRRACRLEGEGVGRHVDHLRANDGGEVPHLRARVGRLADFSQAQFARDDALRVEVGHVERIDQPVEEAQDLLDLTPRPVRDDGEARDGCVFGRPDGDAL